ncbi:MAG TPA: ankyrin repeat domain-containing protein [Mycobacteriales bacterium]
MPVRLPNDPSPEHFRRLARRLHREVRAGRPDAVALARRYAFDPDRFALSAAQLVVAREAGFPSWPRLRAFLDSTGPLRRDPDTTPPAADPTDEFCRLACLAYGGDDGPDRWSAASALLAADPALPTRSVYAAAAAGDPAALGTHLAAAAPGGASARGGPYGWEPLLYLTYSRVPQVDPLAAATLLLDAGADPDAGFAWHGLVPPFTALTGAFGGGEGGPGRQPPHPRSLELARLLLDAGADPNDGQTLYNRMFRPGDDWLELLFAYGLGTGDGGVWRHRLGAAQESPAQLLVRPLTWAAAHGFSDRVRLLLEHGVDPDGLSPEGRAADLAAAAGHRDIVAALVAAGAEPPRPAGVDAVVGAVLAGDAVDPAALAAVRAARPGLVAEAVDAGADPGPAVALGFDVSAPAGGQTALHTAAWNGDLAVVRRLVELRADVTARDAHFGTRPVDWARHGRHADVVAYLETVTPPD